ncbi:hypothetical protein LRAMOSA00863 [Lichtheimia ramosa]|uniref:Cas1p 10 TM acyl transferase domain-containing protein n=1 Tax=Lichtheimia ramosa TaxID=688394 RepID=A0A077W8U6_9FUNG|nr:hypothetical protein LRAMOSA00863 [Lichtheimia ramosa]
MLEDGWWQDTNMFTKWQPAGCMMHTYKAPEISSCLNHSRILYVGDSIVRQQFFAFAQQIHADIDTTGPKHVDRRYQFNDQHLVFEFWWDPYLNTSRTIDMLKTTDPAIRPSLLVLGSGAWYMRYLEDDYREEWQDAVDRVFDSVERSGRVADAVILSPVEVPEFDLLSPDRERTMSLDKVDSMNSYLQSRIDSIHALTPITIPFVWNKVSGDALNMTEDGIHFATPVTTMQVQLALNYRCNDQLAKHFPMDSTCCFHYPIPRWYQNIFFLLFLFWVPIGIYTLSSEQSILKNLRHYFPTESTLNALFIFGLGVVYMFFGDRTHMLGKAQKLFDPVVFSVLIILTLGAGILTLKVKKEGDQGFLNRDQTDEWKGWMQVVILVYHFLGASSVSGIYNPVRVLVAAYLFQTGYGHFFFFYKKSDFGLARVLNVLVRLNLLTFVLQYVMDTDYLSYYFTPLVTFWFGVIWITMYVGHSSNKTPWFLISKLVLASILTTAIIHVEGVLEGLFDLFGLLFNIHWNAQEWRFRLGLDAWIIYIGMLCAYGNIKFAEYRMHEHPMWQTAKKITIGVSTVAMIGYFVLELSLPSKFEYNKLHPYISWIPILAFVVLRNASVKLRNTSSRFFIFFGRISLETFIGQFHMWLAGDTKGLLVVIAHPRAMHGFGWWFNFAVSSSLFVFVCYYLSQSTGEITKVLCAALNPPHATNPEYQAVPLLPTTTTSQQQQQQAQEGSKSNPDDITAASTSAASTEETQPAASDLESSSSLQQPSRVAYLWKDGRIRTGLLLLAIGILNHFC